MSDGMGRELAYLSSHAINRYFIPNWGILLVLCYRHGTSIPDFNTLVSDSKKSKNDCYGKR